MIEIHSTEELLDYVEKTKQIAKDFLIKNKLTTEDNLPTVNVLSAMFSAGNMLHSISFEYGQGFNDIVKVPLNENEPFEVYVRVEPNSEYPVYRRYDDNLQTFIEEYRFDGTVESKYCILTGNLLQQNVFSKFDTLPESVKTEFETFLFKNAIVEYSYKPYGLIVEVIFPIDRKVHLFKPPTTSDPPQVK